MTNLRTYHVVVSDMFDVTWSHTTLGRVAYIAQVLRGIPANFCPAVAFRALIFSRCSSHVAWSGSLAAEYKCMRPSCRSQQFKFHAAGGNTRKFLSLKTVQTSGRTERWKNKKDKQGGHPTTKKC